MDSYIDPGDQRYSARARKLVAIGRDAIAKADDAALDAYFAPDYVLHGPDGDVDFPTLKAFFASMRSAMAEFACERIFLIEQGNFIAARTVMTGIFMHPLAGTAVGTIPPNNRTIRRELQNIFRFADDGRLAEEWVRYDNLSFLKQLGVDLLKGESPPS